MRDALLAFSQQFAFAPEVDRAPLLRPFRRALVCGMGGSHLAADLLKELVPELPILVHHDYGLPFLSPAEARDTLVIASSYSGNTEESIDAFRLAMSRGMALAAMSVGGELRTMADAAGVPFVALPDTGIQPRSALGFSLRGLLALLGRHDLLQQTTKLAELIQPAAFEPTGKFLASQLAGRVPVIYASEKHESLAYNWKIKLNETGKIPAFCNTLPELNHNEMTGFDVQPTTRMLSDRLAFVFLTNTQDDPRIQKRMAILRDLYRERGLKVIEYVIEGQDVWLATFAALLTADWMSVAIAETYGLESEQVPMVEDFKQRMKA